MTIEGLKITGAAATLLGGGIGLVIGVGIVIVLTGGTYMVIKDLTSDKPKMMKVLS